MLYSLVFALIYFAVLGIIIIFDMKNRKIKKIYVRLFKGMKMKLKRK